MPNKEFSLDRFRQDVAFAKSAGRITDAFFVCDAETALQALDSAEAALKSGDKRSTFPKLGTGTVHELKCWPNFFDVIEDGTKPFEVRSEEDRQFSVGDILQLREWDPGTESYTGRSCGRRIEYVLRNFPGIQKGYAILGFVK